MTLQEVRKELSELPCDVANKDCKEDLLFNAITMHHKIRHAKRHLKLFPDLPNFNRRFKHKVNVWKILLTETIKKYHGL